MNPEPLHLATSERESDSGHLARPESHPAECEPPRGTSGAETENSTLRAMQESIALDLGPGAAESDSEKSSDGEFTLDQAVDEILEDLLVCTKCWSAWSYGTMRDEDFYEASGDDDIRAQAHDAIVRLTAPLHRRVQELEAANEVLAEENSHLTALVADSPESGVRVRGGLVLEVDPETNSLSHADHLPTNAELTAFVQDLLRDGDLDFRDLCAVEQVTARWVTISGAPFVFVDEAAHEVAK